MDAAGKQELMVPQTCLLDPDRNGISRLACDLELHGSAGLLLNDHGP
jgi:hypothetical protein